MGSLLALLGLAAACLFLFALPSIVANKRNHRNRTAIAVCSLFFWPVAMIWALTDNCEPSDPQYVAPEDGSTLGLSHPSECHVCGKTSCSNLSHAR